MHPIRIAGLVLFAIGLVLLYFGYSATETLGEQVSETLTGRFTDETMGYLIAGVACVVAGGAMALFGKR